MTRNSDPEWRKFEKLVSRLETDALGHGYTVKSPDKIRCKITGRMREVDASIRPLNKNLNALTTVECRRRNSRQDVTWIEQLATKRTSIGAVKTIAVSSRGFSAAAKKLAKSKKIELRTMDELDAGNLSPILGLDLVVFWHHRAAIFSTSLRFYTEGEWIPPEAGGNDYLFPEDTDLKAPIFCNADEGHRWSINDIWHQLQETVSPFDGIEKGQRPQIRTACFPYPGNVNVDLGDQTARLGDVILSVALWIEAEPVSIEEATKFAYAGEDQPPIHRVEFQSKETEDWWLSLQSDCDSTDIKSIKTGGNWPVQDDSVMPKK